MVTFVSWLKVEKNSALKMCSNLLVMKQLRTIAKAVASRAPLVPENITVIIDSQAPGTVRKNSLVSLKKPPKESKK